MDSLAGATSILSPTQIRSGIDPNDPAGKDDIVTTGELHVPVDRPVIAELSSKDVIHDYFIPDMRIAGDAIPGSLIPIWFTPVKTGTYEVICAQLCGLGHYGMKGTLVVDTPQDYQAWLKERAELAGTQATPPAPTQRPPGEPIGGAPPGDNSAARRAQASECRRARRRCFAAPCTTAAQRACIFSFADSLTVAASLCEAPR